MKVIATRTDRQYSDTPDVFIAEVSLREIQKLTNKTGYKDFERADVERLLKPGMEYDLGAGYDFRSDIVAAVKAMEEAHKKFAAATAVMHRFVALINEQESGAQAQDVPA